jgi:hypothetical protein
MEFLYVDFLYVFRTSFVNEAEVMAEANNVGGPSASHRRIIRDLGGKKYLRDARAVAIIDQKNKYLNYKGKAFRSHMQHFLSKLEPRHYSAGSGLIQEQNEEVYEVFYIMEGKVGVGYRIFNTMFFALALQAGNSVNDYAMIRSKVSEFVYQPILDNV